MGNAGEAAMLRAGGIRSITHRKPLVTEFPVGIARARNYNFVRTKRERRILCYIMGSLLSVLSLCLACGGWLEVDWMTSGR